MGKDRGFIEFDREVRGREPIEDRVKNFKEFEIAPSVEHIKQQGARCMDCGVPFCHSGCPLGNHIPDWNDHLCNGRWREAIDELHATNNFPEFTGRVCPAPCESSCTLGINIDPVSIKFNEVSIIDKAFDEGWVVPTEPTERTGKKVAVIGSGPAGLAAAEQLNRAGHSVTLFERADRFGGLLMYGIPDFKLEKTKVQRRIDLMEKSGVVLKPNTHVGVNYATEDLKKNFDAVCLAGGSTKPRDLPVDGRDLGGVHFAMEFLPQQNKRNWGDDLSSDSNHKDILATDKKVVILGGGDTGSDCVGTSIRQGASSIKQFELLPKPDEGRADDNPWPQWPLIFRTSSSQEEGCERGFNIMTKSISPSESDPTKVGKLNCVKVEWVKDDAGNWKMSEVAGSEFTEDVDLVLLAMGFLHPEPDGMLAELGVDLNDRGNVKVDDKKQTSVQGVFAAGDMERGQSLVVWAITAGRTAAREIDRYLMGDTVLP